MRLFILLMLFSGAVQASAYKCKDATGKTTYQQSPCAEAELVKGYVFHEESEATKVELKRVANDKYEKRIAVDKIKQATRISHNSDNYKAAQSNLLAAKINARTQQQASFDENRRLSMKLLDSANRLADPLYRLRHRK